MSSISQGSNIKEVNVDNNTVSTSGIVGKASGTNADFITAYASGTTVTCSTLPSDVTSIKADDIVSIMQIATDGSVTGTYTRDDIVIVAAGTDPTTLTVTGAITFTGTDSFVIYTNIPQTRGDKVDLIEVLGTATNVNGGNRDAGTQTVTLADDDPVVTGLSDKTQMTVLTDGTNEGIIKLGKTFTINDVALGVADANVLAAVAIPATIVGGTNDVTTAGTREALGASTVIKSVTIRAKATNTGNIYVGGVTVDSTNGIALAANDSVEIDIKNLATVYIDSSVNGEGVGFTYFN